LENPRKLSKSSLKIEKISRIFSALSFPASSSSLELLALEGEALLLFSEISKIRHGAFPESFYLRSRFNLLLLALMEGLHRFLANHPAIPSSRRKEKASKTEKQFLAACG